VGQAASLPNVVAGWQFAPRLKIWKVPMNASQGASTPWFLIVGLLAGAGFVGYIVWDSARSSAKKGGIATSEHVVELTLDNWQQEVVESKVPVFVDFTAKWCPPCKAFAPTVNRLAERYQGKIKVAKFDVGDHGFDMAGDLPKKYGFSGVPQIMLFDGGEKPLFQQGGGESENVLARRFDKLLASRRSESQ
jgi:thioredoxin 1